MNAIAPPFPQNPSVGESFGNWTWNGVRWVCGASTGITVIQTVMTASGPYMPSPGLVSVQVEAIGGGGGGGGALGNQANTSVAGWIMAGGGGGAGAYARSILPASIVLGGVNVTIGAGGAGGSGNPPFNGSSGAATTFGALVSANGGIFGSSGVAGNQFGPGGAGGQSGVGQAVFYGNGGMAGIAYYWDPGVAGGTAIGGQGGAGAFGGAPASVDITTGSAIDGFPGQYGAGGGGGASGLLTLNALGGAGGNGACIITEYCWTDADTGGDCLNPPINVNARVAVTQVPWTGPGPCPPGWGQLEYDGE